MAFINASYTPIVGYRASTAGLFDCRLGTWAAKTGTHKLQNRDKHRAAPQGRFAKRASLTEEAARARK